MKKIIDISYHQNPDRINYDKLLAQVDGVMVRLGYGTGKDGEWPNQPDPAFERHYAEVKARNIPVGCYHFMVEYKPVEAQLEIVDKAMMGKTFNLRFWPDVEYEQHAPPLTRDTVNEYMTKADDWLPGGTAGVYTGEWCWNPIMGKNNPYSKKRLWMARYGASAFPLPYGWDKWFMWQYTSSGRLDGYYGNLDMNSMSDENFSALMGGQVPEPDEVLFQAEVICTALNVRSTPVYYADNRNVVDQLSKGDVMDVYEIFDANGWYRIGKNRWCSGDKIYVQTVMAPEPVHDLAWLLDLHENPKKHPELR